MITSQGGSVGWRFTQNPTGHDYGHHMSKVRILRQYDVILYNLVQYNTIPCLTSTTVSILSSSHSMYLFCIFLTINIHL